MKVESLLYKKDEGWDGKIPFDLDSENTLVMVFGSASYINEPEPFEILASFFPNSKIVGCSSAGEIFGQNVFDETLSISVVRFDRTKILTASSRLTGPSDSFSAGATVAAQLYDDNLMGVLVFSEGLNVSGTELVNGINSILPPTVKVTGGLAGDNAEFKLTWVTEDGKPVENTVTAVGFYGGHISFGHGSQGGWDIFGLERRVTRSEGNVLYELDGKPALDLYKKYLGERAADLPSSALLFPLSLREAGADDKKLVRSVLGIDEEQKSLIFAGDVPQGSLVQLMSGNFERLIDGAGEAAKMAGTAVDADGDRLCLSISCVGRRMILGERVEEELEAVMELMPGNTFQTGFYSYGEISPFQSGFCDLHNQTMTVTTISEGAAA